MIRNLSALNDILQKHLSSLMKEGEGRGGGIQPKPLIRPHEFKSGNILLRHPSNFAPQAAGLSCLKPGGRKRAGTSKIGMLMGMAPG